MNELSKISPEAHQPSDIASKLCDVGVSKSSKSFLDLTILGILAGAFVALAANFTAIAVHDSTKIIGFGLTQVVGGLCFSLGLILVVIAGSELFTGNTLMTMTFLARKISFRGLMRNWSIVYIANLLGSLSIVSLAYYAGQWTMHDSMVGGKAILIANAKVNLITGNHDYMGYLTAFSRGILCNALVCLAVWLASGAKSTGDKILAIIFPITAFYAAGFEHSVANMYILPMGIVLKSHPAAVAAAAALNGKAVSLTNLTYLGAIRNLIPVTLGNIVGGGIMVGAIYWLIYLRKEQPAEEPEVQFQTCPVQQQKREPEPDLEITLGPSGANK